jgi:outer membrane immunogenic protein
MIRHAVWVGVGAIALTASAYATDFGGYRGYADVPASTWTGFYIGVNGGYAFDAINNHGGVEDNGGFGGGQIGYNVQGAFGMSPLVLGIEVDFQGTGIDHTGNGTLRNLSTGAVYPDLHTRSIDDFGTVRGRLGYACGSALVYFTGGFAYGSEKNVFDNLATNNIYRADGTQTGYVLGGGVEYKIAAAWSFKAEYQFVDLAADRPIGNLGGYVITKDTELNTVRGGLNFHFNSPVDPLK